jgi:hypothetical protein
MQAPAPATITLTLFPIFIVLLCFTAHAHRERLWWLAGGLGLGAWLGVFGLLAGYYISYAIGLVRWRFGMLRAKEERDAK